MALQLFRIASEADPRNATVRQAWALMEKDNRNFDKARELFQKATEADQRHAPSWQAWALMEKENRNFDKAQELFQKATEADQRHAPSWQAWALMEEQNGDRKAAQAVLEKGLQSVYDQKGKAILLSAMGVLLARQRDFDQAKRCFAEALNFDDRNPLTHYHFAVECLLPAGNNREKACQHLRRALQLRPRKNRDLERIQQALEKSCNRTS